MRLDYPTPSTLGQFPVTVAADSEKTLIGKIGKSNHRGNSFIRATPLAFCCGGDPVDLNRIVANLCRNELFAFA
jgi:hypothetical protein